MVVFISKTFSTLVASNLEQSKMKILAIFYILMIIIVAVASNAAIVDSKTSKNLLKTFKIKGLGQFADLNAAKPYEGGNQGSTIISDKIRIDYVNAGP